MATFKYRILFVDDDSSVRETGAAILRSQGYEVLAAKDGLDALACLSAALPELIISDLRMPKMSGFELLAVVRNRFPQIPTIAISGEYVTDDIPDGLLADAFLRKGHYDMADYFTKIKELLHKPPARAFPGTRNTSPIWVALRGDGEVLVTCPRCLRSFEIDLEEMVVGLHEAVCGSCQNAFDYNIDQHSMDAVTGPKLVARLKKKARPA